MSLTVGLLVMAGIAATTKAKNKVEDEITTGSDSFTKYDSLFTDAARKYGVDFGMLKAICMNESSLGEAASVRRGLASPNDVEGSKSSDGKSWGLMQVTIPTARDFDKSATAMKLNNPAYSIDLAGKILQWLERQLGKGATEWIVKSYNQGIGNTKKEMAKTSPGYAGEYWARYQRNRNLIKTKQGV